MAASLPFEEAVEKTIEKVIPTLMTIESTRDYSKGSDKHYKYVYLAERLVTNIDRRSIKDQQISQLYTVFRNIYGPQQALALMILLFKVCEDVPSAEELEALVPQSDSGNRHRASAALLFSGERVKEDDREKFNVRSLISRLASELDESQQVNFITLLRGRLNTAEKRSTNFQTILLLMTKAFTSGKITAQELSKQLLEWLSQLGISEDGDLSVMKEIKEFDPKKPFPGAAVAPVIPRQTSADSAIGEDCPCDEHITTDHHPQSTSVESYERESSRFVSRGSSTEEVGPTERSEMVASKP